MNAFFLLLYLRLEEVTGKKGENFEVWPICISIHIKSTIEYEIWQRTQL